MRSFADHWRRKFAAALAGLGWAVQTQSSVWAHLVAAALVTGLAAWLRLEAWRWAVIVTAITVVSAAELLNTAIEQTIRTLHPARNRELGRALDVAAGAVLVTALGAVVLGIVALAEPLWRAWSP